jgi:hypothetical protein
MQIAEGIVVFLDHEEGPGPLKLGVEPKIGISTHTPVLHRDSLYRFVCVFDARNVHDCRIAQVIPVVIAPGARRNTAEVTDRLTVLTLKVRNHAQVKLGAKVVWGPPGNTPKITGGGFIFAIIEGFDTLVVEIKPPRRSGNGLDVHAGAVATRNQLDNLGLPETDGAVDRTELFKCLTEERVVCRALAATIAVKS